MTKAQAGTCTDPLSNNDNHQHPFFPALPPSPPSQYILHNNNRQNIFEKTHQKLEGTIRCIVQTASCQFSPPVDPSSLILVQCGLPMIFAIHGCRQIFNFSHICLVIVELLQKMDVHSKWFSNGDCLSRHVLPPAKERGGKVNVPLRFGATFTQSLLFWPTYHKHLVSLLEDCSLIHILKKSLKHNHYWAKINMSHQPDDDVKGTRFAYLDLVPDRI